jgi:hypothetical protein
MASPTWPAAARRALPPPCKSKPTCLSNCGTNPSARKSARAARIQMGVSRKQRAGHLDQIAATVILQSYLDARSGIYQNSPGTLCAP